MESVETRAPGRYERLLQRLADTAAWDGLIAAAVPAARRLVSQERVRSVLHGDATGVPVHAIMTDAPFGAWFGAQYLDLFADPGSRRAARRLIGLGLLCWTPTALAGLAEWAQADRATRRVGVVHAGLNGLAALVFTGSWVARVTDRQRLGVDLARAGGVVLIAGGFLGGYMGGGRRGRGTPAAEAP
jgi:hypothetical protein